MLEGFWPSSNWKVNHLQFSFPIPAILANQEDPIIPLYCGIKNMKPFLSTTTYTPFRNLHEFFFILAHPFDPKVYLVWMGRAHNDVLKDGNDNHYRMVHVQWWTPCKKGACNNLDLYQDCWQGRWNQNLVDPMQWVDIDSIAFLFCARKNTMVNNTITISDVHVTWAKVNIDVANEVNHI